jgi:hypothetical protein
MKRYNRNTQWVSIKLEENLRFSDLYKSGLSDLTNEFKKVRTKALGSESKNAKLVGLKVNRKSGWVQFNFVTRKTPYEDENHKYTRTIPEVGFKLVPDETNYYELKIRVLDFFKWLKTTPETSSRDLSAVTDKDIEDVLKVADIKVFCDCPSFHWQGFNYHLSTFNASIFPTKIKDKSWGKRHNNGDSLICKHLQGLLNNIHFYIPQMRQAVKKYLGK